MQMKAVFSVSISLAAAAWLAGCAMPPQNPMLSECPGGKKDVTVGYGDSRLEADAKVNVKPDGALVFRLRPSSIKGPNGLDYSTALVTIKGKDAKSRWISASGTAAGSDNQLTVCVPDDQAEDTYEYFVEVAGVGMLDPRVIVQK
jgi:hypothetical protein